jgi:hypothetical protein
MTPRRAQSDGEHAASYYGTTTPIASVDTLPPDSPPRVVIVQSAPPSRAPLDETPPPSLIETPSGDRSIETVPGAFQRRMTLIIGVGAFALTLTFALGFALVWLTVKMHTPVEPAAELPPPAAEALPSASALVRGRP